METIIDSSRDYKKVGYWYPNEGILFFKDISINIIQLLLDFCF
jgi:hypothetical protein